MFFKRLIILILSILTCRLLSIYVSDSIVLSASLTGLIGSIIFFRSSELQKLFYCGSFIGMSAPFLIDRLDLSLITILICAILYQLLSKLFLGYGGKLGAIAFTSCFLGYIWIL